MEILTIIKIKMVKFLKTQVIFNHIFQLIFDVDTEI